MIDISMFEIALILLSAFMIASSIIAVWFKDLLASTIALAVMSLILSLYFYMLHAPDVAIAEAGVGACITTALLVIAIKNTERMEEVEE
ncbi:MAG TPA: DUF4040 domain-containing protein [Thermoplasmatales archaeon]|jgi:uncharacterized MnhB-related membrane protein|nr:DUF4040 domain-containing protein [Thermoplasmata archaeon]HHO57333.1 DUF4040 domain-containing protein [Thermoplasmatales archaeon]